MSGPIETRILASRELEAHAWLFELEGALDGGETLIAFENALKLKAAEGFAWIVLDVSKVKTFVDLGHGSVVYLNHLLHQQGGKLVFVGMPPRVFTVFELLGLDDQFAFATDLNAANEQIRRFKQLAERGRYLYRVGRPHDKPGQRFKSDPIVLTSYTLPDRPAHLIVEMEGALNSTNVIWFESWMKEREKEGFLHYVWDLSQAKYLSSTGEGSFTYAAEAYPKQGRLWAVCNVNPRFMVIVNMLGLDQLYDLYDTVDEALKLAHGKRPPPPKDSEPDINTAKPARIRPLTKHSKQVVELELSGEARGEDIGSLESAVSRATSPITRYVILEVSGLTTLVPKTEAWLIKWAGELVRRGGCVALVGLREDLASRLESVGALSAFEHYPSMENARHSIDAVLRKEPAYVVEARRNEELAAATVTLGKTLGPDAEEQLRRYLQDFLKLTWLRFLVIDASDSKTVAPEVELQITNAAQALKERKGLLAVAGASNGLRDNLAAGGGEKLYMYFDTAEGAREFIEAEFLHEAG